MSRILIKTFLLTFQLFQYKNEKMNTNDKLTENTNIDVPAVTFKLPLFKYLDKSEIIEVLKLGRKEIYLSNSIILKENKPCNSLYILIKGNVNVVKTSSVKKDIYIASLGPGSSIGEMSIFTNGIASATVKAYHKDVCILEIDKDKLEYFFEKNLKIANSVLRGLLSDISERLKATTLEKINIADIQTLYL